MSPPGKTDSKSNGSGDQGHAALRTGVPNEQRDPDAANPVLPVPRGAQGGARSRTAARHIGGAGDNVPGAPQLLASDIQNITARAGANRPGMSERIRADDLHAIVSAAWDHFRGNCSGGEKQKRRSSGSSKKVPANNKGGRSPPADRGQHVQSSPKPGQGDKSKKTDLKPTVPKPGAGGAGKVPKPTKSRTTDSDIQGLRRKIVAKMWRNLSVRMGGVTLRDILGVNHESVETFVNGIEVGTLVRMERDVTDSYRIYGVSASFLEISGFMEQDIFSTDWSTSVEVEGWWEKHKARRELIKYRRDLKSSARKRRWVSPIHPDEASNDIDLVEVIRSLGSSGLGQVLALSPIPRGVPVPSVQVPPTSDSAPVSGHWRRVIITFPAGNIHSLALGASHASYAGSGRFNVFVVNRDTANGRSLVFANNTEGCDEMPGDETPGSSSLQQVSGVEHIELDPVDGAGGEHELALGAAASGGVTPEVVPESAGATPVAHRTRSQERLAEPGKEPSL